MGQDIRIGMSLKAANVGNFETTNGQGPPFDKAVGIISKTYTEQLISGFSFGFYRLTLMLHKLICKICQLLAGQGF